MVNLRRDIDAVGVGGLHVGAQPFVDSAAGTPEIDVGARGRGSRAVARHVAFLYLAAGDNNWADGCGKLIVGVRTRIEFLDIRVAANLQVAQLAGIAASCTDNLDEVSAVGNPAIVAVAVVIVGEAAVVDFALAHEADAGFGQFEPTTAVPDADGGIRRTAGDALCHTHADVWHEVEADGRYLSTVFGVVGVPTVVGLLVVVLVHTHDGAGLGCVKRRLTYYILIVVEIAHEHDGLRVRVGAAGHVTDQSAEVGIDGPSVVGGRNYIGEVGLSAVAIVVAEVGARVAQIESIGKVGLDADGRHAVGHDVVAALGKDIGVGGGIVDVLCRAVAVGEVIVLQRACRSAGDGGYLPAGADFAVVARPAFKLVGERQDHLAPGEVVAQGVHVGDGQVAGEAAAVDADIDSEVAAVAHLGELFAGEVFGSGGQVGRYFFCGLLRVGLPRLDDGIRRHLRLQHPVAYLGHLGIRRRIVASAEEEVGGQLAVGVLDVAVEGEARQEHVYVNGQLVVVGRVREVRTRAVVVVFGQLLHVVGVVAAIDGRAVGAGGEVTVHHAVGDAHTRGVDGRVAADGALVAAHDAGGIVAAADAGIVVAIHHADVGARSNQSHQSAGIGRAADAAAQHAAVIDLC